MTTPRFTALSPEAFRRTPWKNGGGVTVDIADAYRPGAVEGGWEGMIWRFGRTSISIAAHFSDLTGYERMQIVVAGSGLVLETPTGEIDVRRPFTPVRFDGGTPIVSRLENGPVEVVNLMADRTLCDIDLTVTQKDGALDLAAGAHVIYAAQAPIAATMAGLSISVPPLHALRFDTHEATRLTVQSGPMIVAAVRRLQPTG